MKERNIATCVILSIVTCGIYSIIWFISLTNDLKYLSRDEETASGGIAFVFNMITCGIYGIYWAYKRGQNLEEANRIKGLSKSDSSVLFLILALFGFQWVVLILLQSDVNRLIDMKDNVI